MQGYDKAITPLRLTVGYTYRILLTKNLSLNLGVDGNIGLFTGFTPQDGYPNGYLYFYQNENTAIYNYGFIRSRLKYETFFNIIYFRGGLSFAI